MARAGRAASALRGEHDGTVRLMAVLILSVLAAMAVFFLLTQELGIGRLSRRVIDDRLSVDVVHPDGSVDHSDSSYFTPAHKRDVIRINVPLDEELRQDAAALCFSFYNSLIRVEFGEETLYRYGDDRAASGRQIGHLEVGVPIPEAAWGSALTIVATPQENNSTSSIRGVSVMPAVDARIYPLADNEFDFLIFLTLLVFSLTGFIAFSLAWLFGYRRTTQGIFLTLFLVFVCFWYLGYQGLFYLFSDNIPICANIEYYALFAFPIPFLGYVRREKLPRSARRILGALEAALALLLAAATALTVSPVGVRYIDFLTPERLLILVTIVTSMALLVRSGSREQDVSEKMLRFGLVATMALAALETVRIALNSVTGLAVANPFVQMYVHLNFSRVIILVFLFVLVSSYCLRLSGMVRTDMERRQLEKLAFTDMLTGIPNRQDCERNIEDMDDALRRDSVVLFLDVNDLKLANDAYSHDMGDELLRQVAAAIRRAMAGREGFYGRYGGDEFLICVYRGETAEAVRRSFYDAIDAANRRGALPFPIRVACGMAAYSELAGEGSRGRRINLQEMIRRADARMYEEKRAMKGDTIASRDAL